MSQVDKTLWIAGDSYGTFDKTDGTHWVKQLAIHYGCTRVFNLARGGMDNTAINFVAEEILNNHLWPGRTNDQMFNYDTDVLIVFCTQPGRFCHRRTPYHNFIIDKSIANLNWHTPYLKQQEPMPWIDDMPKDSSMFSQTYNSIAGADAPLLSEGIDIDAHQVQFINDSVMYNDTNYENVRNAQQLAGVIGFFESRADGAIIHIINQGYQMPHIAKYRLPDWCELLGEMPDQEDTLVNHLTAKQHNDFWEQLKQRPLIL